VPDASKAWGSIVSSASFHVVVWKAWPVAERCSAIATELPKNVRPSTAMRSSSMALSRNRLAGVSG
jgi:hypothetical protein